MKVKDTVYLRYNSNSVSEKAPEMIRRPALRSRVETSTKVEEDWDAIDEIDDVSNELSINFINKTHWNMEDNMGNGTSVVRRWDGRT